MPLSEMERLYSLPSWDGRSRFGLDTPRQLLAFFGNPQDSVAAIHVAGTNGKGSVSAMLAAMLQASGKRVGLFTSPHLSGVNERCVINGLPVEQRAFADGVGEVFTAADTLGLAPSFFEVLTVASFLEFARAELDWMVIEVGLGGRLDATNTMLAPRATVVTSISYDHENILGSTLQAIAQEKAGIFRAGVPVYCGSVSNEVEVTLKQRAQESSSPIELLGDEMGLTTLALSGKHQQQNARLATRVALALELDASDVARGLSCVRWPGRLERLEQGGVQYLLDGAHNPDGLSALLTYLSEDIVPQVTERASIVFIIGIMARKNWREMLRLLRNFDKQQHQSRISIVVGFTRFGEATEVSPDELHSVYGSGEAFDHIDQALAWGANTALTDGLVVVAGSLYLIGKVRPMLTDQPFCVYKSN